MDPLILAMVLVGLLQFWLSLSRTSLEKKKGPFLSGYIGGSLFFAMLEAWLFSHFLDSWAGSMQCLLFICLWVFYLLVLVALPLQLSRLDKKWIHTLGNAGSFLWKLFAWIAFLVPDFHKEEELPADEQIMAMIHEASENEKIEDGQKEIIENVLDLDDTPIEEICTRRSEVISLDSADSMEEWQKIIHANRHTFYPILGETDDDVLGILDTRDYFRLDDFSRDSVFEKAVDKPLFVYENTKADDMFLQMKENRNYFAIVLDEYGGVTGIVTLHDIVESLLGEMQDADEEIEPEDITQLSETRWKIHGSAPLEDVEETLDVHFDSEDYDTFGGYVLGTYGRIPEDGLMKLHVDLGPVDVLIREVKSHRVGLCIVDKKTEEKEEEKENERFKRSH